MELPQTFVRDGKTYQLDPLGKERLLKLADFLDELPEKNFNFGTVRRVSYECGTVGCAVGWLPEVFPGDWVVSINGYAVDLIGCEYYSFRAAGEYFGITHQESKNLFDLQTNGPYEQLGFHLYRDVKAPTVAQVIREFVEGLPCSA